MTHDEKLLQYACEHDIINMSDVQNLYEMDKRKEILKNHGSKIWQGKNGRWYTYLTDERGVRKQVTRKTRTSLEDAIVANAKEQEENPTLNKVFKEWLKKKVELDDIAQSTRTRYENDWKSYFKEFGKRRITKITELDIENFVLRTIHERQMTIKAFGGMRTILYGVFRHAKKKRLVDYNIKQVIADIDFSRKTFRKIVKTDIEQVFFVNEEQEVIKYLTDHPDIVNLGLLLVFKSGLRIGELVVLQHSDISGNLVDVNKTETSYMKNGKWIREVKYSPKTEAGNRQVIVPDNCLWILKEIRKLNPFGEWVFMHDGKRYSTDAFRKRLYQICEKTEAVKKSPHKIRKTYGSILYDDKNIPESLICSQMGHTDITCLQKYYYFNRHTKEQQAEMINKIAGL